jgi:hypothetical protein
MKLNLGQRHKNARALVKMLKSQCVSVSAVGHKPLGFSIEMDRWLENNAGKQLYSIPFAEAEAGYLPDITNKWASHLTITRLIYWIQNKETRVEFAMRWL